MKSITDMDMLSHLVKQFADGILTINQQHQITGWQAAAKELFHLETKDKGKLIDDIVGQRDFISQLETYGHLELTLPYQRGKRTLIMGLLTHGDNYQLIARDITASHELDKLRQDFVANVSHELRTPLTVVHGYIEMLQDLYLDQDERLLKILRIIQTQTDRMKNLVEDLLLLSRLEHKPMNPLQNQTVDVSDLIKNICHEMQHLVSQQQHNFITDITPDLNLQGEPTELRSAFSNLVLNAVRYTPKGGTITVRWFANNKGKHFVVKDTGIGISQEHIPRLTERFYRVDKGRSRNIGGTGLGLAIVKHVLLRHQGKLTITSKFSQGSQFMCSFPKQN
ncbi:MAG: phosphate regulon sensor histidine kinase PhoR [Legionellales bacterium]|nr:phosphate regulon sensor histidine kinase PhoR [Legionellales bacterium]